LPSARSDHRSTLVFFVSPTCPVCKTLYPVLAASRSDEQAWLDIFLASDGEPAAQRELVRQHGLARFPYVISAALGLSFHVSRLPYAVLIDADGVVRARGLVNSLEHLESLFEAQRLGVASLQDYLSASR
jgi:methylamine dehydrogenase accessory protein MauD